MSELGSLSQSARKHSLKGARGILIFVGVLTLLVNGGLALFAEQFVNSQIPAGEAVPQNLIDEAVQSVRISGFGFALLGVVFLIGAAKIYDYPVPVTIISLVLYLGGNAITAMLDPTSLAQGFIIKIFIIIGLVKAVGTAMAYERERAAEGDADSTDDRSGADAFSV